MSEPRGLERVLAASAARRTALRGIERAAASEAPILLTGEEGTGRSTVAAAVHAHGARADGALVEVDLASVPPSLFESELFGHRPGAFSGPAGGRRGRVALAARGTLLLDRIEELPIEVQPKLLRLLSEGTYDPLGGDTEVSRARIVAIGADDLESRRRQGLLREDLFHRLDVLSFRLPSLREHPEEIDDWVAVLLDELSQRSGTKLRLGEQSRAWMRGYSWPGNLRQLRNVLARQLILDGGPVLSPPEPAEARARRPRRLAEVERDEIAKALEFTRGNQTRAAEILGISRKSLWEKRRRYDLP